MKDAVGKLAVKARILTAGSQAEIEAAFTTFAREGVKAVFAINGFLFYSLSDLLAALALRNRMALSGELRAFPEQGGLMSYGPNEFDAWRRIARYAVRVLKGEKPADLPVMEPTKLEFVINLRTARALGLALPNAMQLLADEVIE